jgi:hypothetical protein
MLLLCGLAFDEDLINGWFQGIDEASFLPNITNHEALSPYWNNVTMTGQWSRVTSPAVHLTGFVVPHG